VPGISVVIPVYGVAEFLPACLDSILDCDESDLEVIAVDDASPDDCGKILDDRAAADPRLRVLHLAQNAGRGHARNLALGLVTGDYVWFVDGDDGVAASGLTAVIAALAVSKPDVLLIDWVNWYPGGRTAANHGSALLKSVPAAGCTLEERPQLINLTMTSWSKLFRTDFLRGLRVSFAGGIHEDVLVTCAALLSAHLIQAVDEVCYRYRRERTGSAMATTSRAHLAVFDSYRHVFELLAGRDAAGHPVSDELRAAVFERAIWHYSTVLQTTGPGIGRFGFPGLVPRAERHAFFRRMHEDFARYRPAGYEHPTGLRGTKLKLIERNAYWTYSVLEPVNRARVGIRRLVGGG
jgi:CDP-glycerol glycerophosphotransferase